MIFPGHYGDFYRSGEGVGFYLALIAQTKFVIPIRDGSKEEIHQLELHRLRPAEGPSLLQANHPWYGLATETSDRPCQSNSLTKERSLNRAQAILREIPTTNECTVRNSLCCNLGIRIK